MSRREKGNDAVTEASPHHYDEAVRRPLVILLTVAFACAVGCWHKSIRAHNGRNLNNNGEGFRPQGTDIQVSQVGKFHREHELSPSKERGRTPALIRYVLALHHTNIIRWSEDGNLTTRSAFLTESTDIHYQVAIKTIISDCIRLLVVGNLLARSDSNIEVPRLHKPVSCCLPGDIWIRYASIELEIKVPDNPWDQFTHLEHRNVPPYAGSRAQTKLIMQSQQKTSVLEVATPESLRASSSDSSMKSSPHRWTAISQD